MGISKNIFWKMFWIFLILSGVCVGQERFFNETCPEDSKEQEVICIQGCQDDYYTCLVNCNDEGDCMRQCLYDTEDCHNNCPCHVFCSAGCPCDGFECQRCEDLHSHDILVCGGECDVLRNQCSHHCQYDDLDCLYDCIADDYKTCINKCPCTNATGPSCEVQNESPEDIWDDIIYGIDDSELRAYGFEEYFRTNDSDGRPIEDFMTPPEGTKYIFMGCGNDDSILKMGVIATPDEMFDPQDYSGNGAIAKSVRNFYLYHHTPGNGSIGFSGTPKVYLHSCDTYESDTNDTKLCNHLKTKSPYRCGIRGGDSSSYSVRLYY